VAVFGIVNFLPFSAAGPVIVGFYLLFFGCFIVVLEFVGIQTIRNYFFFYFTWVGRGFAFMFLGGLVLFECCAPFPLATGIILLGVGVIYIILNFANVVYFPYPLFGGEPQSRGHHGSTTTTTTVTTTRA